MDENQNVPATGTDKGHIPATVTLSDGTEISTSDPAIRQLLIQSATTEKNKLYGTIENLRTENATLKSQRPVEQANTAAAQADSALREQIQQNRDNRQANEQFVTVEKMNEVLANAFQTQLPAIIQQNLAPIVQQTAQLQQETVAQYREKRIAELGETIFPEIVTGSTKEEIESSIEVSRGLRAKYIPQQTQPSTPPVQQPVIPQQTVVLPPAPAAPSPVQILPTPSDHPVDIKAMGMEEFGKNRHELLKGLQAQVNTGYPTLNQ